ncbi:MULTISPECIES: LytR/AlgR family response regulator transcription factor [unclassified Tenacibaculum]|uniref:LytR/AlgR family response regulator transcription factor n=1 Tax=unclassified Tenacibaculum TaxID=2635139 RepID=UPI001F491DD0|nr:MULTISPECIES: LytTR family DNA-binding domain-containing protein [unclassified Tenacibaculum]MCF2875303.1 LytTR family DNA-binding domain-containing protein [Tenacibaculum sp. Cn5-1]MCF2935379.1 LytTR family DNA-binding domain-containing protein [Tenacibaculum sp. Cn5-34]MCG7511939.1 LytTR family DNA-binding domain-containing protein [Tenacibaculum sp. Cn5-46]
MSKKITCVIVDDEPIAREIITSFVTKVPNLELLTTCSNATEAIQFIEKNTVDLFFLDINMPEITGLSLAKIIGQKSKVIFTTAYRDYAVDGFNLNVVDYLLKPIAFERFFEAVQKVTKTNNTLSITKGSSKKEFMFIRSDRKMIKIDFNEIEYIESLGDYVKVFLKENVVVTRETMSNIENKLPQNNFVRIHRSYIVSLNKISSYTNEFIEINKKALPISRSYKESTLQKLAEV